MDLGNFIGIGRSMLIETLIIASPVLIVAISVGLIISILQAITSIQEQTLTFVPKIVVILAVLLFLGPWMANHMMDYTVTLWRQIINV